MVLYFKKKHELCKPCVRETWSCDLVPAFCSTHALRKQKLYIHRVYV